MRREVRWERMFPDELEAAFQECPVVYLPYGLCEPHGPQSALGMDGLRAHAYACHAAREHGGIVAPPFFWNVHELGIYAAWAHPLIGEATPWLTAVPPWLFFHEICYHVRSMDALGFKAILLFSGHDGPHGRDLKLLESILQPHFAARLCFLTDASALRLEGFHHGGKIETSLLWAAEPDCVDTSRFPAPDDPGPHFAMGPDAREADRRLGEELIARFASALAAKAKELLEAYDRLRPQRRPLTFEETERIWQEEIRPRMGEMASMRDTRPGQAPPPPESRWHHNWKVPKLD